MRKCKTQVEDAKHIVSWTWSAEDHRWACTLWQTLCKQLESAKVCMDRTCPECGVHNIREYLPALKDEKIKYKEWKRVEKKVQSKKESIVKVMDLVICEDTFDELVTKLEELTGFSSHLFRARWQQHQLKMSKQNLKPHSAVVIMDYAENYTCTSQDSSFECGQHIPSSLPNRKRATERGFKPQIATIMWIVSHNCLRKTSHFTDCR